MFLHSLGCEAFVGNIFVGNKEPRTKTFNNKIKDVANIFVGKPLVIPSSASPVLATSHPSEDSRHANAPSTAHQCRSPPLAVTPS